MPSGMRVRVEPHKGVGVLTDSVLRRKLGVQSKERILRLGTKQSNDTVRPELHRRAWVYGRKEKDVSCLWRAKWRDLNHIHTVYGSRD